MHQNFDRRTATKVKDGRVQKKNRHALTGKLGCIFDRESPGKGFHHVVSKSDLQNFIGIVPDGGLLIEGLERIILARNDEAGCDAYYQFYHREETGAIFLHAWHDDLWVLINTEYFESHEQVLRTLGVSFDRTNQGVMCRFTPAQARAFMLLHVFLHELGHHHDRMHQQHHNSRRGEDYAEQFANSRFSQIYPAYVSVFGDPARES